MQIVNVKVLLHIRLHFKDHQNQHESMVTVKRFDLASVSLPGFPVQAFLPLSN